MSTVAAILARAARQCSVTAPDNWATATEQTHVELRDDFLVQTVDDVLQQGEWPGPVGKSVTITGTGVEGYDLPTDFLRLKRDELAVYERLRTRRACVPVSTEGEWLYMQELGTAGAYRYYRTRGYEGAFEIDFYRPLETGIEVVVSYVSDKWCIGSGAEKATFTDVDDVSMLPARLLETGIVWRFRERRGMPFADKNAEFEALLARYANDRLGRRTISFGPTETRKPWDVPVPDVLPSS